MLDAAVVVEEGAAGAFHQGLELRHLVGAAADIEHLRAGEVRRGGRVFPSQPAICDLGERELAAQVLAVPRGVLPGALGLRLRERRGVEPAFEALAVRGLAVSRRSRSTSAFLAAREVVALVPGLGRRLRRARGSAPR